MKPEVRALIDELNLKLFGTDLEILERRFL